MEGDIAEGDMKPPAEEDGVKNEVQVDRSQEPAKLVGKLKMVSKCDGVQEKELQSVDDETSVCPKEADKNSTDPKPLPVVSKEKTADGYNWRKYGQKQVKNPEGSRSYYRCTFSNCSAKKIERYDCFNCITDVVYKNLHNHDPPQKVNCGGELRPAPNVPVNGGDHITCPVSNFKDPLPKINETIETKHDSLGSDETMNSETKEEVDGPKDERRPKKSPESEMGSRPENGKRPKLIVCEAIDDASKSNDGYRWRKYGQKTVKGTPHPRNYYKCTSAGCPVRKHIEKATDNTGSVIITYKGVHDHDLPLPKKRHESKSPPLLSAATPVSNEKLQINKAEQDLGRTQQAADEKEKPEQNQNQ